MASASTPSLQTSSRRTHVRPRRQSVHEQHMELPQRFQNINEDEEEDSAKTVTDTALPKQSLYGMIAQAGDLGQFNRRWQQGEDSEPEDEREEQLGTGRFTQMVDESKTPNPVTTDTRRHRKKLSESKLFKPLFKARERRESQSEDLMTQSQILPAREAPEETLRRPASVEPTPEAPVLDRRLKAQARAERLETTGGDSTSRRSSQESLSRKRPSAALPGVLAEIFSLDIPEEVIAEYPCWFLQSKLLQGYMYVTKKHVCFYAYLQKKTGTVLKSSYLGKRGKQNPRYHRYWFVLRGTILTYYTNAAQPYFPSGTIDLSYGVSAEVTGEVGTDKEGYFSITTDTRIYQLRADSLVSAQEWVKQLQKVIFRSHNDGDSVKISLPLDNVIDVDVSPVVGSTDTIRLRVIDNQTVSAIDEYFFTFYNGGKDVVRILTTMTKDNVAKTFIANHAASVAQLADSTSAVAPASYAPGIQETVRSTLVQAGAGLGSARVDLDRRPAMSRGRLSFEKPSKLTSNSALIGVTSQLKPAAPHTQDNDLTASQILGGDQAFQEPTLRSQHLRAAATPAENNSRSSSTSAEIGAAAMPPQRDSKESSRTDKGSRDPIKSLQAGTGTAQQQTTYSSPRPSATTLQSASSFAGYVRDQGKRMSSYLSSSPRDYYEKFSGALAGGKRLYVENDGLATEDRIHDPEDDLENAEHERRFRRHFALPATENLVATFYTSLHRVLPLYGKIYLSTRYLCFRSLLYGTRTKIVIPMQDIDNVEKERGFRLGYPGMVLILRGHEELFFDFRSQGLRDDCVVTILRNIDSMQVDTSGIEDDSIDEAAAEYRLLQDAREPGELQFEQHQSDDEDLAFDDGTASVLDFKPKTSLRIVCLTIGSRGDVQPYIALCKGLIAEGHRPKIATHLEFGDWVKSHGIDFTPVGGNPAELMRLCVELGMFTPQFIYETNSKFRGWLDDLLQTAWEACQGCDLLIESPSTMAGIHIAEALSVPYFRAFTMMWTRTRAYPHAFAATNSKMGGTYNLTTYGLFDNLFWQMTASQINRWRMRTLKIGPTTSGKMQQNKVPFLYNFSPSFVAPPLDFSDWVRITGYWFLDEGANWTPPKGLLRFIEQARKDKVKLVYIGFGSIVVADSRALTRSVYAAVHKADVRCILSKGWSDRLNTKNVKDAEETPPDYIYQIGAAPHDWLFKQVDAACHHGGAGTTGASLRAGIPTIIKPFFGDQFFSAGRVEDLGVGIRIKQISENMLGKALWVATHDDRMRKKAAALGAKIRAEDGVGTAIKAIYRDLEYATTLIKRKGSRPVATEGESEDEEPEESWTFVEADSDFDSLGFRKDDPLSRSGEKQRPSQTKGYGLGALVSRARLN
ncbi:hypothetical protein AMS68_001051 [Peltaster fructicola]|uniref:sterol 3beta-glucosyltransferase n=1 Tax=Peltaster fructicola TaxID=286661 RepID=A0A6H0XLC7_9PEZI|nr:hypothetical protein AMS68_001051 [Peltaster fructicola]